jgi:hypothetical protein
MRVKLQKRRIIKMDKEQFDVRGPTEERMRSGAFDVGDDKQGTRVYRFCDDPMSRLYSRLSRAANTHQEHSLRREYAALLKYRNHWHQAGLEPSMGSVDLNRIFASDASNMSGMAKTERQSQHRIMWRQARDLIGHRPGIVIDNVVCAENNLDIAGYSVGYGSYKVGKKTYSSPYRAREEATKLLREAAVKLADHWGMT